MADKGVVPIYVDERFTFHPSVLPKTQKRDKKICFGWYGGKTSQLDWLLPMLPKCFHYIEPFGGSAAVLLNRERSPIETYNDIKGDVCNFFRVLRDQPDELVQLLWLSPVSREDFFISLYDTEEVSDLERARRFFVRTNQAHNGGGLKNNQWAHAINASHYGMSAVASKMFGKVEGLKEVAERLLTVQIENRPALDLIKKYDTVNSFFYCDPPYVPSTRVSQGAYEFDMSIDDHIALAETLNGIQGQAAVSGYDCDTMNKMYHGPKWRKYYARERGIGSAKKIGEKRREVLWVNYTPPEVAMDTSDSTTQARGLFG